MKKQSPSEGTLLYILGLTFSTVPPVIAILSYFPMWRTANDGSSICGMALLLLLLAGRPLYKMLRSHLASPASYTLWLCVFVSFFMLARIADEVTVIAFVGFVSNLIGAFFFARSKSEKKNGEMSENE